MKNEDLVARWRNGGEQNNPAGPLFAAGKFAEADITNPGPCQHPTPTCGTVCTMSAFRQCC
jgi:hypothetical protein